MSAAHDSGGLADIPAAKDFSTAEEPAQSSYIFVRGPYRGQDVAALTDDEVYEALHTCPGSFEVERDLLEKELHSRLACDSEKWANLTDAERLAAKKAEKRAKKRDAKTSQARFEQARLEQARRRYDAWCAANPDLNEWDYDYSVFSDHKEAGHFEDVVHLATWERIRDLYREEAVKKSPKESREEKLAKISAWRRQMAKQHHPDLGGDPEEMVRINNEADALEGLLS